MNLLTSHEELNRLVASCLTEHQDTVTIHNRQRLTDHVIDELNANAVLNDQESIRDACRLAIRKIAQALGIYYASTHNLYRAIGRGEVARVTVPAINLRGWTYDLARAIIRTQMALDAGAVSFELARTEMGYTAQPPAEYAATVTAAAIKERYQGPLFLQGDHFQTNAARYAQDPERELKAIRDLITEAIAAGFYNIDIDTSTLVDLSKPTKRLQQKLNYELVADFVRFIRSLEPTGITVSVGGEIGEVGGKNSDLEELDAFMQGLLEKLGPKVDGISKISVASGTTHGGVVLQDGSIATVAIDFGTLRDLSTRARHYGLGGAVQHGASTLPDSAFFHFPATGTVEIHLATQYQNLILDHGLFPPEILTAMYDYLRKTYAAERKPEWSDQQFLYKLRKKVWGPFKKELYAAPESVRDSIMGELEQVFNSLFRQLELLNTKLLIQKYVPDPNLPVTERQCSS